MPRKINNKRKMKRTINVRKSMLQTLFAAERMADAIARFPDLVTELELATGSIFSPEEVTPLKDAMVTSIYMSDLLEPEGRKRTAVWRDWILLELRDLLQAKEISTSLSFTDSCQSEIDRPFARALHAVWNALPVSCRGRSKEAFVARARTWRRKEMPDWLGQFELVGRKFRLSYSQQAHRTHVVARHWETEMLEFAEEVP